MRSVGQRRIPFERRWHRGTQPIRRERLRHAPNTDALRQARPRNHSTARQPGPGRINGCGPRGCGSRVDYAFSGRDPIVSRMRCGLEIGQPDGFLVRRLARLRTSPVTGAQRRDHRPYGGQARSPPGHLICAAKSRRRWRVKAILHAPTSIGARLPLFPGVVASAHGWSASGTAPRARKP